MKSIATEDTGKPFTKLKISFSFCSRKFKTVGKQTEI
jgi:hypothetical protein